MPDPKTTTLNNLAKCLFGGLSKCEHPIEDYEWKEATSPFSDAFRGDKKIGWFKRLSCKTCGRIIEEEFIKFITEKEVNEWIEREFPWQNCDTYGYVAGNLVTHNLVYGSQDVDKCLKCNRFDQCKRILNNIKIPL